MMVAVWSNLDSYFWLDDGWTVESKSLIRKWWVTVKYRRKDSLVVFLLFRKVQFFA
jgi:hypothetical protein